MTAATSLSPLLTQRTPAYFDHARLRSQYFSSADQLLTLALHAPIDAKVWEVGRQAGVPIVSHATSAEVAAQLINLDRAGLMRADNEYIHCTHFPAAVWERVRDTGGKVSIAPAVEMEEGHGVPPFQAALDHGIRPSLSTDVETSMTSDLFTIMRETRRHGAGNFLCGGDDYFCRQETREIGGNDRVRVGEIRFRRGDDRFHDGHDCFEYIDDRIRSVNDRVRTHKHHVAFKNDRLRLGNPRLRNGNYRFRPGNDNFRRTSKPAK